MSLIGKNRSAEQRPCRECTHRRIYHFRMVAPTKRRFAGGGVALDEVETTCSMPDCTCSHYSPALEAVNV